MACRSPGVSGRVFALPHAPAGSTLFLVVVLLLFSGRQPGLHAPLQVRAAALRPRPQRAGAEGLRCEACSRLAALAHRHGDM